MFAADLPAQSVRPIAVMDAMKASIEKQHAAAAIQKGSIEAQRAAARRGAEAAGTAQPGPSPGIEPPCEPAPVADIAPIIDSTAKAQGMDQSLVRAVVEQESGYRSCAVSEKGALGLMQLMPDTAGQFGVADPFDASQNVEAGVKFLKQLIERYKGDLSLALAAYNAGPATVDDAGTIPPIQETQDYVSAILRKIGRRPAQPPSN